MVNLSLLLSVVTPFPEAEHVLLRIFADREVTHLRHSCFWDMDFATEFFDRCSKFADRVDANVVGNCLSRAFTGHQPAVQCVVRAACVDVHVIGYPRHICDLPAKQLAVKRFCPVDVVSRDFKPDNIRSNAISGFSFCVCLRAHALCISPFGSIISVTEFWISGYKQLPDIRRVHPTTRSSRPARSHARHRMFCVLPPSDTAEAIRLSGAFCLRPVLRM